MLDVDATQLIAIMLAARSFLLATLLAACVVGFTCQILASDLAIHITASALDIGVQVAVRTFIDMARCFADMWITCAKALLYIYNNKTQSMQYFEMLTRLTAFQTLRTDFVTGGHRIQATLSLLH